MNTLLAKLAIRALRAHLAAHLPEILEKRIPWDRIEKALANDIDNAANGVAAAIVPPPTDGKP